MGSGFTLDKLANAMRGTPRDARIYIRADDGRLMDIDYVKPGYFHSDGTPHGLMAGMTNISYYAVVLVTKPRSNQMP